MDVQLAGEKQIQAKIKDLLERAPKSTANAVNEFAINVQAQAKRNLTDLPAVDTGRLRASIRIESFSDGLARRVGSDVVYAPFVEFGSKPHFPPLDPIRAWCRRHSIPESAAYPIALAISRKGQPARPYLFPAYEQERPFFDGFIRDAWRKLI